MFKYKRKDVFWMELRMNRFIMWGFLFGSLNWDRLGALYNQMPVTLIPVDLSILTPWISALSWGTFEEPAYA